jgi:signal transduction histidine kinase
MTGPREPLRREGFAPPTWAQSIRFRLTVLYSTLLFLLAAACLGTTYWAVERSTGPNPITQRYQAELVRRQADGEQVTRTFEVAAVEEIEAEVNLRTLDELREYSIAALGGLFVLSLGIGWVLSGRALRPVRAIAETAREIEATDLSRRIALTGPHDELRSLADTVDSMLDRLEHAFGAQRQLIDDASHELRSPLAIIRANLDASLTPEDAGEAERRRAVAVIDRATTRMSRLVEDLLATARRDAEWMPDTDVRLDAVAREAGEDFAALVAERSVRLHHAPSPELRLIGDPDALRRAVSNLVSNAVRMSPPGSTVTVATGRQGGWLWLTVTDQGPGIGEAERARVFDRFWRGANGTPPEAPTGSAERRAGLGLAIVRQIVEAHGGHVAVYSDLGEGSTFVLWFPAPDRTDDAPPPDAAPRPTTPR